MSCGSSAGTWSSAARTICAARSSGRMLTSDPLPARPIGERATETITASGMGTPLGVGTSPIVPPGRSVRRRFAGRTPAAQSGADGGVAAAPAAAGLRRLDLGAGSGRGLRCGLLDRLRAPRRERAGRADAGAQAERVQTGRQHGLHRLGVALRRWVEPVVGEQLVVAEREDGAEQVAE